jgi:hypothetical protein
LPVTYSKNIQGTSAGFFEYPAGLMAPNPTTVRRPASPFYAYGATYDPAAGRWLPATADAISPDGLSVAYADYDLPPPGTYGMVAANPTAGTVTAVPEIGAIATTGRVHVVDTRTGADRILYQGAPTYSVVGFTADGIYLAQVVLTMDGQSWSGLFLLNPAGGTPRPVAGGSRTMDRPGWWIAGGAAWGTDYSTGGGFGPGNQLVRLDLKTGAASVWSTQAEGMAVALIGIDSLGEALVVVYSSGYSMSGSPPPTQPTQIWVLSAPDTGKVLYQSTDPNASSPSGPSFIDANGVWLSGTSAGSVWLLAAGSGFRSISVPVAGAVGVGGACQ